jgi:hypothetical protein
MGRFAGLASSCAAAPWPNRRRSISAPTFSTSSVSRPSRRASQSAASHPPTLAFARFFVSIDREQVTMLQFGETYTCEINPGPHRLRAHNTMFWKTHQIVLRPGEHVKFTAINRTGTISFGLLFMLGAFPLYLTFERELEKSQTPIPKIY